MLTTARASGILCEAASTALPPRLCPIRIAGARWFLRKWSAAATRSSTLEEKCVLANSPSLAPSPVKSKRSTPIPHIASRSEIRLAARLSLPQVKQCANSAKANGLPSGRSISAANFWPLALENSSRPVRIASLRLLVPLRNMSAPHTPNDPPDCQYRDRHEQCRRERDVDRHPFIVRALDQITEQAHHVVANGGHRQSFDGRLQPQLQPRALVHRAQQVAVLPLKLHVNPRAQQIGGARELLGN